MRSKEIVQIDGIIRGNVVVSIGKKVSIKKILPRPAGLILATPAGETNAFKKKRDINYMGKLLDGLPLVAGDRIRAALFGSRFQYFVALNTIPRYVYVVVFIHRLLSRLKREKKKEPKN